MFSSRYFGVHFSQLWQCWLAQIPGTVIGHFPDEETAALARERVLIHKGDTDARRNFPERELAGASLQSMRRLAHRLKNEQRGKCEYRGVSERHDDHETEFPWAAALSLDGTIHRLGFWKTSKQAALAYDRAALSFGTQRRKPNDLNFPERASKLTPANPGELRAEARALLKATKTSSYRGVHWAARRGVWRASIIHRRKTIELGNFDSEELGGRAYDTAARRLFKSKARLNFHPETEEWMGGMTLREFELAGHKAPVPQPEYRRYGGPLPEKKPPKRRKSKRRYTGVCEHPPGWYRAAVTHQHQFYDLGRYRSERQAAIAYDRALLYLEKFALLNLPRSSQKLGPASPEELKAQAKDLVKRARQRRSTPARRR